MRIKSLALAAALVVPSLVAAAPDTRQNAPESQTQDKTKTNGKAMKMSSADEEVLAHVQHINKMEIDMGKLAEKQGSPAVKRFAETMVRDHQTSDKDINAMMKKSGVSKLPADKMMTEADQKQMQERMTKLKSLKGADFDREYLSMMIEGHEKQIANTDQAISKATDPNVKAMLETRRSTLQRHLETARELQKGNPQASAGGTSGAGTSPSKAPARSPAKK